MSPAIAPAPSIRWRSESKEIGGFYTFLKSEVDKLKAAEGRMRTHAMKQCDVLLKEYVSFNPYIQRLYFEHQKVKKYGDSRYPQAYRYSTMPPRSPSVWDSSPMAAGRKEHSISRQSISASSQHSESTGYESSEQTCARIMAKTPKPERGRNKSPEGAQHRSDSRNPEREGDTRKSPELIRYRSPDSNPERPRQGSPSRISEGSPYKYRKGNQTADRNSYSHRAHFGKTDSTRHLQEARPSEIIAEVARHVIRPLEGSGLHNSAISEGNRCRTAPECMTKSSTTLDWTRYFTTQSRADSFPESGRYRASLQRALEGSHGCLPRSGEGSQGRMLEGLQDGVARMFEGSQTSSMARTFEGSQGGRTFSGQQHASLSSTFGEDGRAEILGNESKTSSSGRWSQETLKVFPLSEGANTYSGSYQSMRQPLLQDVGGFQDDAPPAFNPRLIQGDPPPHRSDPIESSSSSSQATPPQRAQAAQAQDNSHQSSRHASPTKLPAGGIYTYKVPAGGSYRMPDLAQKLPEAELTEGNVYIISDANQHRTSESRSLEHVQVGHLLHGSHSRMPEQERSRTRTPESMLRQKRRKKITPHKCDLKELVPEQRRMKRKKFIQNKVPETKKYTFYKYYGFAGQGAKTSWAHNRPLGMTPPHAQRGAPQLEPEILHH